MSGIVITGMGAITHLGIGHEHLLDGLLSSSKPEPTKWLSAESELELTGYSINNQDEVLKNLLSQFKTRNMDRFAKLNIAAVSMGLRDAGLIEEDLEQTGYIMNTTFGPWESTDRYTKELTEDGPSFASPRLFPNTVVNSAQGHVSITFNMKGPTSTLAGISAIPYAVSLLKKGEAERIIVAGADEINENLMEAYKELGSGITFGEGVGVLVLETLESAQKRNAKIYGEIGDYSLGCEPSMNIWFEDGESETNIFKDLSDGLSFSEDNNNLIVISSSNGAAFVDQLEQSFLHELKNTHSNLKTYNVKNIIGETFGASSIINVISAIQLLNEQKQSTEALILANEIGGNHLSLLLKKNESKLGVKI